MKPPAFRYADPETLDEAIALLSAHDNAKLIAGSQSLMPMLAMRYVLPDALIDLGRVAGLSYIREEPEAIQIGSMTRQRDLEFSPLIRERIPLMSQALEFVGHRQTRNRGTVGGSLCHLDPAAELPCVALAMDATLTVSGPKGSRDIPMAEFHAFYMTPAIERDEILTRIGFRPWSKTHGAAFLEMSRRHGDFASVAVAALIELSPEKTISRASLTVSGLHFAPVRMREAEELMTGSKADSPTLREAAAICGNFPSSGDVYASAAYRRRLAGALSLRALSQAADCASRNVETVPA
jgi:carbon-monoxide dehydrogenase medium subunit